MAETYTCELCGETYTKGWTDEEATKELTQAFPGFAQNQCALVCDDCYHGFMNG